MTHRERAEEIVRKFVERRATLSKARATADEIMNVGMLGADIEQAITAAVEDVARFVESMDKSTRPADVADAIRARCNNDGGTK